jgi:hypothetical protein
MRNHRKKEIPRIIKAIPIIIEYNDATILILYILMMNPGNTLLP